MANFYKKTGVWQAMARNDKFERLTLMVICVLAWLSLVKSRNDANENQSDRGSFVVKRAHLGINAIYIGVDADNNKASTTISAEWPYQVCDHAFCLFFTHRGCHFFSAKLCKLRCEKTELLAECLMQKHSCDAFRKTSFSASEVRTGCPLCCLRTQAQLPARHVVHFRYHARDSKGFDKKLSSTNLQRPQSKKLAAKVAEQESGAARARLKESVSRALRNRLL